MGLEIRKGRDGKPINHWYGSYVDENGRRRVIALTEPLPFRLPSTPEEEAYNPEYIASRTRAQSEFDGFKSQARKKGRDNTLTQKLIESKTRQSWKDPLLSELPEFVKTMKGRRSPEWRKVQIRMVKRFVEWAHNEGKRTLLEITPDVAEQYMEFLKEPGPDGYKKIASTRRMIKSIVSMVIRKKLPSGIESPFKHIRVETEEGEETQHRAALNRDEVDRLLTIAEPDRFIYPLIVTALCTGLRRGDVCRLKWKTVDLTSGGSKLTIKTSKTGAEVELPILPRLQEVLEAALAERRPGAVYVFPEAEHMIENNPSGISYRMKKTFIKAFAKPEEITQDATEIVPLKNVLPKVLEAVECADITESKRDKMIDLLKLYASDKSYRDIQKERDIHRGRISEYLHEAERLSEIRFIPEVKRGGVKQAVKEVTQHKKADGMRDASKYDFHALRTTFVTLALSGKNPMPVEKVIALTGHRLVETAMKFYFKPRGTDFRSDLEMAMPKTLTEGKGALSQPRKVDRVEILAEQFQSLSESDRAKLAMLLMTGGGN